MKGKFKKLLITGVSVALAAVLFAAVIAQGTWDESRAVHISPDSIDNSTLAIGTHLVHLSVLTESIYNIAIESAHESGQEQIYYKSELADGTWFDITTATSLSEITTGGIPVTVDTIQALYFTHHTKSDGVTYDLRTDQPVNIYDIRDPYDLENMEELDPLKKQFELMDELLANFDQMEEESEDGEDSESTNTAPNKEELELNIERCAVVFSTKIESDITKECDNYLNALREYSANKEGEILSEAQKLMDQFDAKRRIEVLKKVNSALETLVAELNLDKALNSMMQTAANDSIANVQASLAENAGRTLEPGTTVLSNLYYELANEAVASPSDAIFEQLVILEHIRSGTIVDRVAEMAMLDEILIPRATSIYSGKLKAGVNSDYNAALGRGDHDALLNRIVNEAMGEVNSVRNELEFFISSRAERCGNEAGIAYLDERLKLTGGWYSTVPSDAFAPRTNASIDSHIEFLTKLRRDIELALGGNEIDALMQEKKDLQDQMMSALDKNDLAGAAKLEKDISAIDDKIAGLNEENSAKANELNNDINNLEKELNFAKSNFGADGIDTDRISKLEADLANKKAELSALSSSMSDGSLGAAAYDLMQACLDIINGDDHGADNIGTLNNNVDTLIGMLPMDQKLIFPDLKKLHEEMTLKSELENTDVFDAAIEAIENAILNNLDGYNAALRTEMNADDLSNLFNDWLLNNSELANDPDGASVVFCIALQSYYDTTGSQGAVSLLNSIPRRQIELGNRLIFHRYNDGGAEYLPITALEKFTGLRYVYYAGRDISTLAKGSRYYGFTTHSDSVIRSGSEKGSDIMSRPAKFQAVLHIPEEYAYDQFGAEALYITVNNYGVLVSEKYQRLADELLALMLA